MWYKENTHLVLYKTKQFNLILQSYIKMSFYQINQKQPDGYYHIPRIAIMHTKLKMWDPKIKEIVRIGSVGIPYWYAPRWSPLVEGGYGIDA